jgi:hypothetical protein
MSFSLVRVYAFRWGPRYEGKTGEYKDGLDLQTVECAQISFDACG